MNYCLVHSFLYCRNSQVNVLEKPQLNIFIILFISIFFRIFKIRFYSKEEINLHKNIIFFEVLKLYSLYILMNELTLFLGYYFISNIFIKNLNFKLNQCMTEIDIKQKIVKMYNRCKTNIILTISIFQIYLRR